MKNIKILLLGLGLFTSHIAFGSSERNSVAQKTLVRSLYIFGASCSGKSTLGKALKKNLGKNWIYLDRDDLTQKEAVREEEANDFLEERLNKLLKEKKKVIIDAQIPWRKKKKGELYCRINPPLKTLLTRDLKRARKLKRTKKRNKYARKFVIETYFQLEKIKSSEFDLSMDSSFLTAENEVTMILELLSHTSNCHP